MTDTREAWEAAYLRFETPDEEVRKFRRRLLRLGAGAWPRDARVVELFCGRGSGLLALHGLGFDAVEGVDLSDRLLRTCAGRARLIRADCRRLPFRTHSRDRLAVQGGLHHLSRIPEDLVLTLREAHRVLRPGGRIVVVEPWRTPFLTFIHFASALPFARWSRKLEAFATMTRHEHDTYFRWLSEGRRIRAAFEEHFRPLCSRFRWGKWEAVGEPRPLRGA